MPVGSSSPASGRDPSRRAQARWQRERRFGLGYMARAAHGLHTIGKTRARGRRGQSGPDSLSETRVTGPSADSDSAAGQARTVTLRAVSGPQICKNHDL